MLNTSALYTLCTGVHFTKCIIYLVCRTEHTHMLYHAIMYNQLFDQFLIGLQFVFANTTKNYFLKLKLWENKLLCMCFLKQIMTWKY